MMTAIKIEIINNWLRLNLSLHINWRELSPAHTRSPVAQDDIQAAD